MATIVRTQNSRSWDSYPEDVRKIATELQDARVKNYQITPISRTVADLDQDKGYQIAASLKALREETAGEVVAGRKIGFTNRNIWPEYNIDRSNWSYMYKNTVIDLTDDSHDRLSHESGIAEVDISQLSNLQPKIEPEVVLGLANPVSASMNDAELLSSLEWIAHGFEVVASVYPDWRFTAADTTAAFALHGLLLVGPKIYVQEAATRSPERLLQSLMGFKIELRQNGKKVDQGGGSNVLGSPIKALRHLVELLEKDEYNLPLAAGETVTTGTLTRALDIHHDDVWSTKISGIELHGLEVRFKMK
jgi:2-oxo-3-hexenedioate decarboxylase